ncbi:SanA/YdcF family protein [Gordonia zhaorongruii]|uniref:SanA/YdcF family protein n=1 Tax=Gordonia zhaorongruii TaxID=2597659 RepID=UPI0010441B14|nr:YdcF family protein [Gordonia zhaorongruii]
MCTRRRYGLLVSVLLVAVESVVAVTSAWVAIASRGRVVEPVQIPVDAPRTLIVLGAKVEDGEVGDYIAARLDVAVELYRSGRVEKILSSGNDADDAGNEVRVMRAYLEAHGVPAEAILDDPLGTNTAATCRRARSVFGIRSALIVTQNFHVGRAVMLCEAHGVQALGVIARCDHCTRLSMVRNHLRESLGSRPRAVLEVLRTSR